MSRQQNDELRPGAALRPILRCIVLGGSAVAAGIGLMNLKPGKATSVLRPAANPKRLEATGLN